MVDLDPGNGPPGSPFYTLEIPVCWSGVTVQQARSITESTHSSFLFADGYKGARAVTACAAWLLYPTWDKCVCDADPGRPQTGHFPTG